MEPDEEPDEMNDWGRYSAKCKPSGEDELFFVILRLVEQACGRYGSDEVDSLAISAYELVL